jgi:hypothetical protein
MDLQTIRTCQSFSPTSAFQWSWQYPVYIDPVSFLDPHPTTEIWPSTKTTSIRTGVLNSFGLSSFPRLHGSTRSIRSDWSWRRITRLSLSNEGLPCAVWCWQWPMALKNVSCNLRYPWFVSVAHTSSFQNASRRRESRLLQDVGYPSLLMKDCLQAIVLSPRSQTCGIRMLAIHSHVMTTLDAMRVKSDRPMECVYLFLRCLDQ